MNVYCYYEDVNKYQSLAALDAQTQHVFRGFTAQPFGASWKPMPVALNDSEGKLGDFCNLTGAFGVPVFSEKAWTVLEPLIGESVEALPLICEHRYVYRGRRWRVVAGGP